MEVLTDRVGTGLLVASVVGVLAAGLAARPLVVAETDARERAADAILGVIDHSGNPELIRNKETAQTARLADGYFRTCIARDDRRRFWCYFIDREQASGGGRARPEPVAEPAGGLALVERREPAVRPDLEQLDRVAARVAATPRA